MHRTRRHAGWSRSGINLTATTVVALWVSGMVMYLLARDGALDVPPWQQATAHSATVTHGLLSWLALLLAGRWIWPHATLVWQRRRYRAPWLLGIAALTLTSALSLLALGLLYGQGDWHGALAQWHWLIGLGWPLLLLVHVGHARASARARTG